MHDLTLARDILNLVLEYAKKNKLKSVSRVKVELGKISAHGEDITPTNLKFNFNLLKKNTLVERARLEIKRVKGRSFNLKEIVGKIN